MMAAETSCKEKLKKKKEKIRFFFGWRDAFFDVAKAIPGRNGGGGGGQGPCSQLFDSLQLFIFPCSYDILSLFPCFPVQISHVPLFPKTRGRNLEGPHYYIFVPI